MEKGIRLIWKASIFLSFSNGLLSHWAIGYRRLLSKPRRWKWKSMRTSIRTSWSIMAKRMRDARLWWLMVTDLQSPWAPWQVTWFNWFNHNEKKMWTRNYESDWSFYELVRWGSWTHTDTHAGHEKLLGMIKGTGANRICIGSINENQWGHVAFLFHSLTLIMYSRAETESTATQHHRTHVCEIMWICMQDCVNDTASRKIHGWGTLHFKVRT